METTAQKQDEKVINYLTTLNIDIDLAYAYQPGMTFDELEEEVTTLIHQTEVIYYSNAIEYLKDNDPSLKDSLNIASEMGYTPENLSSETLATLLKQQILFDEWAELRPDVEYFWNEIFEL